MKNVHGLLGVALATAGVSVAACASRGAEDSGGSGTGAATGQVDLAISTPAGFEPANQLTWWTMIETQTRVTTSGWFVVDAAPSQHFVLVGLAPGEYDIRILTTESSGDPCAAETTFGIVAGAVTDVPVSFACADAGAATPPEASAPDPCAEVLCLDASVATVTAVSCPGISSFSMNPSELSVGDSSQLAVTVVWSDPQGWTVYWSQSGAGAGTFSDASIATPAFTCARPGSVTITATVGLPDSGACTGAAFTTISTLATCESGDAASGD
jgi:hypothetical protein